MTIIHVSLTLIMHQKKKKSLREKKRKDPVSETGNC